MNSEDLIVGMCRPEAYPHRVDAVEVIQTHASVVFLAGDHAYKLKKPVDFGFLDYSSLEKRRRMCEAEVELNRTLAPDVYLGVVRVTRGDEGVRVGGAGETVEHAVHMRRLPDGARLSTKLDEDGRLEPALLDRVAQRLARFHRNARRGPTSARWAQAEVIAENCRDNLDALEHGVGRVLAAPVADRLREATERELELRGGLIGERARHVACEIHGDLRLEHIYVLDDRGPPNDLCIVDCIEFNDAFRHGDPISDIAFLVMDLEVAGADRSAEQFATSYLVASDDGEGAQLLPLYVSYRSAVRAKVRALQADATEIDATARSAALARAQAHALRALVALESPAERPAVVLVGGLPGTGKSAVCRDLRDAARFRWISSDIVRKELAGLAPTAHGTTGVREGIYSPQWNERTYRACLERAMAAVFEGERVLVDASFKREHRRRQFIEMAIEMGVPVRFLECEAPEELVRTRLARRVDDPSDADAEIYEYVRATWEPAGADTEARRDSVDTSGDRASALRSALGALAAAGLASAPPPLAAR